MVSAGVSSVAAVASHSATKSTSLCVLCGSMTLCEAGPKGVEWGMGQAMTTGAWATETKRPEWLRPTAAVTRAPA
jgi:hypothetical protein